MVWPVEASRKGRLAEPPGSLDGEGIIFGYPKILGTLLQMPAITTAIAAELANGARDALRQGAAVATGNQGNYIANGEPESIYGRIQQETARQACRRYADDPEQFTGRALVLVENACRPYLDDIGYGQPPAIELPFRGGQCYGLEYRVVTAFNQPPIGAQTNEQLVSARVVGTFRGVKQPNQTTPVGIELQAGPGAPVTRLNIASLQDEFLGTFRIVSVFRSDGGLDSCGNVPPEIRPPIPPPVPGPRREPFSPGPGIDIDIDVQINPDLTIEVDFGVGPITIDPFGDDGDGGGSGGGGGGDGGPGSPGSPSDTGLGGDAEGEAGDGQILTGLRIDFLEPPVGGKEYAPGVYRGVCYIYMGTAEGLDHDPAGAMLRDGQFVYAEKDFLTRWAVSANMGYNLRVTPYYRADEAGE